MDNQTLGIIAAVVVIAGSVFYLNMGSGASTSKSSSKDGKDGSKNGKDEKKEKVNILLLRKHDRTFDLTYTL